MKKRRSRRGRRQYSSSRPDRLRIVSCLGGLCLLGWAEPLGGQTLPATLETRGALILENDGDRLIAPDGAVVRWDEIVLEVHHLLIDRSEGIIELGGPLRLSGRETLLLASELDFRQADGTVQASGLRIGRAPIFGELGSITGTLERVQVDDLLLFPHEPRPLSPNFRLRQAEYIVERGQFRGRGAVVGIGRWPVLYWPALNLEPGGLLPEGAFVAGQSSANGVEAGFRATLPVNARLAPGGEIRVLTERGLLLGPAVRYAHRQGDDWFVDGRLASGWIRDQGEPGLDRQGESIGPSRGFIDWSHQSDNREDLSLQIQLQAWSDSEVTRDFRPDLFRGNEYPASFLSATWQPGPGQLNLLTQGDPNGFHPMAERWPELTFQLRPFTPATGWLGQGYASVAVLRETAREEDPALQNTAPPPFADPRLRSERVDTGVQLEYQWTPARGLSLTPGVGGRITHYERARERSDAYTRLLGEISLVARGEITGTFAGVNAVRGIDGLRHRIHPEIAYVWIPRADQGSPFIPLVDRRPTLNRLPRYRLAERADLDAMETTHLLRFGLEQVLETRDPRLGTRSLATLEIWQDWHFTDDPGRSERLPPLQWEGTLHPFPGVDLEIFQRLDHQQALVEESHHRIRLRDRREWEAGLTHYYRQDTFSLLGVDLQRRLNERYTVFFSTLYDIEENLWPETTAGLRQALQDTWEIDYGLRWRNGNAREGRFSFTASAQLLTF